MTEPIFDPNAGTEIFAGYIRGTDLSFPQDIPAAMKPTAARLVFCDLKTGGLHQPIAQLTQVTRALGSWLEGAATPNLTIVSPSIETTWKRLEHFGRLQHGDMAHFPMLYVDLFDAFFGPGLAARTSERDGATLPFMCSALGIEAPSTFDQVGNALSALWKKLRP